MSVHSFFPLLPSLTLPYSLPLLVASCRKDKVLSVITAEGEESVVFYEYLLFTNGTQYIREQDSGQAPPFGVFTLNSVEDEEEFGKWAEELLAGGKGTRLLSVCLSDWLCACVLIHLYLYPAGRVAVYGGSLAVYTAVEGLLQLGVRGRDITLVHPSPPACFNNLSVEGRVALELEQAGMYCAARVCRERGLQRSLSIEITDYCCLIILSTYEVLTVRPRHASKFSPIWRMCKLTNIQCVFIASLWCVLLITSCTYVVCTCIN